MLLGCLCIGICMQVNLPATEGNFEVIVLDKLQFCDYKAISPKQTFEYEI